MKEPETGRNLSPGSGCADTEWEALPNPDTGAQVRASAGADPTAEMAVLHVDEHCVIRECNSTSERLFKFPRNELVGRSIYSLLPELQETDLVRDGRPNPRLHFLCRIGRHFQAMTGTGERFASELFLNFLDNSGHHMLSIIVRPAHEGVGHRWAGPWLSHECVGQL